MKRKIRHPSGFTMLEVLIATTIMSFAVIAVTQAVAVAQMQTYEALHDNRAITLAESFLEEVVSKAYADPAGGTPDDLGPDTGETSRSLFDNIDDYHGFTLDTLKEDPDVITDIAENVYPLTYQKFSVNISTTYTTVTLFESVTGINVIVTVTDKTGRSWQAMRFVPESGG